MVRIVEVFSNDLAFISQGAAIYRNLGYPCRKRRKFVHRFAGSYVQGLLPSIFWFKNSKWGKFNCSTAYKKLLLLYGNLWSVLFVQPFVGHLFQGLLGMWTLFPWIFCFKNRKIDHVRLYVSLIIWILFFIDHLV